jgi:hypothetical protein
VANLSPRQQTFEFALDPVQYGGVSGTGNSLLVTSLRKEGNVPCGFTTAPVLERQEIPAPWEARVIEIKRVPSAAAVPAAVASRPDAARFRLEAWAAARGVRWAVNLPTDGVAERDGAGPEVWVKSGGLTPTAWCDRDGERGPLAAFRPAAGRPGWLKAPVTLLIPARRDEGDLLRATLHLQLDATHGLAIPWQAPIVRGLQVTVQLPEGDVRAGETVVARVCLRNHRGAPVPAGSRVMLQAPADWDLWPGRSLTFGALAPHEEATCAVRCRVPASAAQGGDALKAYVVEGEASRDLRVGAPRPQVSAARMTPTVDGDLAEWSELAPVALGPAQAGNIKGYGGASDLSARVWLAADDRALYVAALVTDNQHTQANERANMWQGDAIQFDLRPGMPPRHSTFDGVLEFGLALTPGGPQLWSWMPEERVVSEARVQVVRAGDQTRYEAAIPWSALPGLSPSPGAVAAFSLTVNECDGKEFRGWLELTPGICGGKDASRFAVLRL